MSLQTNISHSKSGETVVAVLPCYKCLDEAREKGYKAGFEEGENTLAE